MLPFFQRAHAGLHMHLGAKGFGKYFSNTAWLMVDNVSSLAIGLLTGIFVARYLGPSDFGLLNFGKSIAKFASVLCALGLERIVIRSLVHEPQEPGPVLGTSLLLKWLASTIVVLLFAVVGAFVLDTSAYSITLILVVAVYFEAFVVIRYYFASQVKSRFISRAVLVKIALSSSIKIVLIYLRAPLVYFAFEILLEALLAALAYIYVYHRSGKLRIRAWRFDANKAESLLKDSWPMLISGLVIFIYTETDIIMLRFMLGDADVGHYSVAVRMTTVWYLAGTVICNSLFPAILNAKARDESLYRQRLIHLLRLLLVISFSLSLLITVFAPWVVSLLFGNQYAPAASALTILAWSLNFVYLGIAGTQWYLAEHLQRYMVLRSVAGALVNIALNVILIPRFGISGAAVATVVAQMASGYWGNLLSSKTRPLFFLQTQAMLFVRKKEN
jgi:O-antigen/teichoic acid export membrane protein